MGLISGFPMGPQLVGVPNNTEKGLFRMRAIWPHGPVVHMEKLHFSIGK